jgi:hypothetical protein
MKTYKVNVCAVCVHYRNPNHWTNINEIWHEYTPQWGKVHSWDSTPTPGVRGALTRVCPASAASTVQCGKNFILYKTKVVKTKVVKSCRVPLF